MQVIKQKNILQGKSSNQVLVNKNVDDWLLLTWVFLIQVIIIISQNCFCETVELTKF